MPVHQQNVRLRNVQCTFLAVGPAIKQCERRGGGRRILLHNKSYLLFTRTRESSKACKAAGILQGPQKHLSESSKTTCPVRILQPP